MPKIPLNLRHVSVPIGQSSGSTSSLAKVKLHTINMYTYVSDVGAPTSHTYVYMLMAYSVTLARLDVLPEDSPTGTETCRRFYRIFSVLMCVNMF